MSTSPANILKVVENTIKSVEDHKSLINMIASAAGILPEVSLAEKALPAIVTVLQFIEGASGKSPFEAFEELLSHITPGKPNSAALSLPEGS